MEERVVSVRLALERKKQVEEIALVLVERAIPCILHCENRINEHIFDVLLNKGILRYGDGGGRQRKAFQDAVKTTMKTAVLGTPTRPSQWTFPLAENGKTAVKENLITHGQENI
jgi:hypothetical protein